MAAILKAAGGVGSYDSRWATCLLRHYPHTDPELSDSIISLVAYVIAGAPKLWSPTESKGGRGVKTSAIRPLKEVQAAFGSHQGSLAALLGAYRSWNQVAKRERPRWCRRHHLNSSTLAAVQDAELRLRAQLDRLGRRQSLRSAAVGIVGHPTVSLHQRLCKFLMGVFPESVYVRWHKSNTYMSLTTVTSRLVDFADQCLLEEKLPEYILYLPNVSSRKDEDDFNPTTEVCINLALEPGTEEHLCRSVPAIERSRSKVDPHLPVSVEPPAVGDAVLLKLAGSRSAQNELKEAFKEVCSKPSMMISVDLHEPKRDGERWRLEVVCSRMYQSKVEAILKERVKVAIDELESDVDLMPFPDPNSGMRVLLGCGVQVQDLQSRNSTVILYVIGHDHVVDTTELTEECVEEYCQRFGKVECLRQSRRFPKQTLWGSIQFELQSSAQKAVKATFCNNVDSASEAHMIKGYKVQFVSTQPACMTYHLKYRWRRMNLVRNRLHMYFSNEEDLKQLKQCKSRRWNNAEYDEDELKVTVTSDDPFASLVDQCAMMYDMPVYPKLTTYSHQVVYEASTADIEKVSTEMAKRMAEIFTDPDLVQMTTDTPKPGASVMTGTFTSVCHLSLVRLEDILCYGNDPLLAGGEVALDQGAWIKFSLPREAYTFLYPGLKSMQKNIINRQRDQTSEFGSNAGPDESHSQDEMEVMDEDREITHVKTLNDPDSGRVTVEVYLAFYMGRDEEHARAVFKLLTPKIIQVSSDLLALLISSREGSSTPRFMEIMAETDTFLQVLRRDSRIKIYGKGANCEKAHKKIIGFRPENTMSRATANTTTSGSESLMCPVCLCDLQGETYRLSLCGHEYCQQCLRQLITTAMDMRKFRLECVFDGCDRPLLTADVMRLCALCDLDSHALIKSSLQAYQRANAKYARPCITPDCEMVYQAWSSKRESPECALTCPLCNVTLCTQCHTPYHHGFSCAVIKVMDTVDEKVRKWMGEDRVSRKLCPNCHTGIEKVDGCDNLHCTACEVDICWTCLQFFTNARTLAYHRCPENQDDDESIPES